MKKLLSIVLALTMTLSLAACGSSEKPAETTTAPATLNMPASALEALETVWAAYGEDEKFAVIGGSMANPTDGAPGSFALDDENISYNLLIPAEQLGNVMEAASMIHMMNANTFTCAAYKLGDVAAADFAAAMKDAILGNMWMCGFPEELVITSIGGMYVVVTFGVADVMETYKANLAEAYPSAQTLIAEPIV